MRRGELYADQIRVRIVRPRGQVLMHRLHHARRVVRPCDRQHARMLALDQFLTRAKASGDDDLAVLGQRLADRVERFLDRGVDEAAGVDDDEVSAGVIGRGGVTLSAQLREDALRVDERLRTA